MTKQEKRVFVAVDELLERTVEEGECRVWQGFMKKVLNPMVRHGGVQVPVRKLVAQLSGRPVLAGGYWSTRCGTVGCIAPDHIVRRNTREHFRRMAGKLHSSPAAMAVRNAKISQMRRRHGKLSQEQIQELMHSNETSREAAARLGISRATVRKYQTGVSGATLDRNPWLQLLRLAGVEQKGEGK